jgi:hypothetical protein
MFVPIVFGAVWGQVNRFTSNVKRFIFEDAPPHYLLGLRMDFDAEIFTARREDLMTDFATSRDAAFVNKIQPAIEDFASQFEINSHSNLEKRRTIFLFPGGIGSQLMRAFQSFPDPPQSFERVWLDAGLLFDAPHLTILPGGIDTEQKYVVPDGCVDIPGIVLLSPYDNFIQWCRLNSIDLFVFGWDWRRSVQDAADFFLKIFLPMFDARFGGQTPHPLDHFTLLGHSAGGMVVKAILNSTADQFVQRAEKAITVATPFYGYGGQIHRYLKGDPYLSPEILPCSVATRIISSLPGGYEYLYLDHPTYQANQVAFTNDPEGFNLTAYPSLDADDPTVVADPYDPQPDAAGNVRYPLHFGFESSLLHRGNVTTHNVSKAFTDPATTAKFFNIRGVQSDNGQIVNNTCVGQSWARIPPDFDPDLDVDPIEDKMGPGDGTQPAWTARLLGLPANQIITIVDDEIDHPTMLNARIVQTKIAELIGLDVSALRFGIDVLGFAQLAVGLSEFNTILDEVGKLTVGSELTFEQRNALMSDFLRNFTPAQMQGFLARYYLEALRQPSKARASSARLRSALN